MKHTGGPWSVCRASSGQCECRMVWAGQDGPAEANIATATFPRSVVACVHQEWGDGPDMVYGTVDPDQTLGNAYLISAAPDLLEALKSIENDDGSIPEPIWKMRNDAIAKALGQ